MEQAVPVGMVVLLTKKSNKPMQEEKLKIFKPKRKLARSLALH
jgi:hypothetical protein